MRVLRRLVIVLLLLVVLVLGALVTLLPTLAQSPAVKAGIQKTVRFHSLRTSFITWGLERGDSMSELLNATLHSSARMLRYYDRTDTLKKNSIFKTQV
jgi:integrase